MTLMDCYSWIAFVLAGLFVVVPSAAQELDEGPSSIGFAHPDSTQPVRAYRLPTWQWSTWTLQATGESS